MNQHARTSRGHARTGQSIFRILFILAVFTAVFATAWIVGTDVVTPNGPPTSDVYRGIVQLAPNQQGRCDKVDLKNETRNMSWQGSGRCGELTTGVSGSSGSSVGRLNSISDYFRSR